MRISRAAGRRIEDRLTGGNARFDGILTLTPDDRGLIWCETGTLCLEGVPPVTATRRYLWREGPDGTIGVFFDDGRPFHSFRPDGRPEAAHWCDPDSYDARYDFTRWPDWEAVWTVRGPRKDYTSHTRYSPCEDGAAAAQPGRPGQSERTSSWARSCA